MPAPQAAHARPQTRRRAPRHGAYYLGPAAATNDRRITLELFYTLCTLSTYQTSPAGYIQAPQSAIAARLGLSRPSINAHLKGLEQLGYLQSYRRRRPDGGESEKYYKIVMEYQLAPEHYRALPPDYGQEPGEESPATPATPATQAAPPFAPMTPVSPTLTPPVSPTLTPPVSVGLTPRARASIKALSDGGGGLTRARAREGGDATEEAITTAAAEVRRVTNMGLHQPESQLRALVVRWLDTGMTADEIITAAAAAAEWWTTERGKALRLDKLGEWLQRDWQKRERDRAADRAAADDAARERQERQERAEHASQDRAIKRSHGASHGASHGRRATAAGQRYAATDSAPVFEWDDTRNAWNIHRADGSIEYCEPEQPAACAYEHLASPGRA